MRSQEKFWQQIDVESGRPQTDVVAILQVANRGNSFLSKIHRKYSDQKLAVFFLIFLTCYVWNECTKIVHIFWWLAEIKVHDRKTLEGDDCNFPLHFPTEL